LLGFCKFRGGKEQAFLFSSSDTTSYGAIGITAYLENGRTIEAISLDEIGRW
jgi:hypothetical protein